MYRTINIILTYLAAIVAANMLALYMGQNALIITAVFLVPFDFVLRAYFHERWKGKKLIKNLGRIIVTGGILTYIINSSALNIAAGSTAGFLFANFLASIYYQALIKKSYFVKVNGSDLIAIVADSFIFQLIAFNDVSFTVMAAQIVLKIVGGLFWYWLIFYKLQLHKKWK